LPQDQLAVWNEWQRWVVEPGEITVWVGGSSDATLSADLVLKA
jgi:beta-glucosidase